VVFASFTFIFYFLPLVLAAYYLSPRIFKNFILLCASLIFYSWDGINFITTLLGLCLIDYLLAIGIFKTAHKPKISFYLVSLAVIINISILGYFKYAGFFTRQTAELLSLDKETIKYFTHIALPIGISFFTFHKISYLVDVYRGIRKPTQNIINYFLYILFFPQLIAGPIIRYHEIDDQLTSHKTKLDDLYQGWIRFSFGLAKKVLIADTLAHIADRIWGFSPQALTSGYAWLGLTCYTLQIYFDFSGYSDMAIGLARMFGFRFPENFNYPYIAENFTDFWRRWHISLSRWMKEYLYLPLGGNRGSAFRAILNLWIVFIFSGFWHGAKWNFLAWGAFHGFFLTLDKTKLGKAISKSPITIKIPLTIFLVMLGWVLFRSDSLTQAGLFYQRLFGYNAIQALSVPWGKIITIQQIFVLILAVIICFIPLLFKGKFEAQNKNQLTLLNYNNPFIVILVSIFSIFFFCLSIIALASSNFSPFIYFQF
jgi:alginate O-acetyltransferase complex protein AlgI